MIKKLMTTAIILLFAFAIIPFNASSIDYYCARSVPGGWTMWSPYMDFKENTTAHGLMFDVLDGWNDMLFIVCGLDAEIQEYSDMTYIREFSTERDFQLYAGVGYFVWCFDSPKALMWGSLDNTHSVSIPLYDGWNLIGLGYPAEECRASVFMSEYVYNCTPFAMCAYLNGYLVSYMNDGFGTNFIVNKYYGYYLYVFGNGTLDFGSR